MLNYVNALQRYLFYIEYQKALSEKTVKAYRIDLTQFFQFLDAKDVCRETIQAYVVNLNERFKPKSVKRKVAAVKAFFAYLEDENIIDASPFHKIKIAIKEPQRLPRTIPLNVVKQLLSHAYKRANDPHLCDRYRVAAYRDAAVMELLFSTGLRVSELCSLTSNDIDLRNRTLRIIGKGDKERILHIGSKETLESLKRYQKQFKGAIKKSGYFFVNRFGHRLSEESVREMLCNYCSRLHISLHITPHMFRHTFATTLLESDVDIRYIQRILGHSSITTTQIYTYVTNRKQSRILRTKNPRSRIDLVYNYTTG